MNHELTIVPAPKMDTPSLVAAECSCGSYRSGSTTEDEARKSWQQHTDAKLTAAYDKFEEHWS